MAPDRFDFEDLRARVRSWPISREEAHDLAHDATCGILDCAAAADLCEELTETLQSIEICDWLGKGVGAAMRERAADLINQIESATSESSRRSHANGNRLAWDEEAFPSGDFRGSYGYGRPAHKADPAAAYAFDIGAPRALPPRSRIAPTRLIRAVRRSRGN